MIIKILSYFFIINLTRVICTCCLNTVHTMHNFVALENKEKQILWWHFRTNPKYILISLAWDLGTLLDKINQTQIWHLIIFTNIEERTKHLKKDQEHKTILKNTLWAAANLSLREAQDFEDIFKTHLCCVEYES